MESIIKHIKERFVIEKKEYFEIFARNDSRVESWFKAEMMVLFEQLKNQGLIDSYEREYPVNRRRIDFLIRIREIGHLCELKALCISKAKTSRGLKFYFNDNELLKDFRKLKQISYRNKWILAFIYPKPSDYDWLEIITSMPDDVHNWQCISDINDYPRYLFIAIWKS